MSMPIEAKEVAVGDWSPNYGSVVEVKENKNSSGEILSYSFKFFNGYEITNVKPDYQMVIEQGGSAIVHTDPLNKNQIRPGLDADHAKD